MTQPPNHTYRDLDITEYGDENPEMLGKCVECGLPESAHGQLPEHPDEIRLRGVETKASTMLNSLARKAAKALREHRRVDAVVLLTQLEVTTDNLRKGMVVAINDQMRAAKAEGNGNG